MSKKDPAITVVMTVFNDQKYLPHALDSIFAQSFSDFECIVVNDGSTDDTKEILTSYNDPRLRIIHQKNAGQVASMNRALKAAKAPLIARHDSDDISTPDRFQKQFSFMQANPEAVLVGSQTYGVDSQNKLLDRRFFALSDAELRLSLLHYNPFVHSAVMYRTQPAIDAGLYRKAYAYAEDYDLWLRLAEVGTVHNLPDFLCYYRQHSSSLSQRFTPAQSRRARRSVSAAWQSLTVTAPSLRDIHKTYRQLDEVFAAQGPASTNLYVRTLFRSIRNKRPLLAAGLSLRILTSPEAWGHIISGPFRQSIERRSRLLFTNDHANVGGGEIYTENVIQALDAHQNHILAPVKSHPSIASSRRIRLAKPFFGIDQYLKRRYRLQAAWYQLNYRSFLRRSPYDILTLGSLNGAFTRPFIKAARASKTPIILIGSTRLNHLPETSRQQIKQQAQQAGQIICPSDIVKDDFIKLGVPRRKLTRVYPPIDTDRFRPTSSKPSYIAWVGRLEAADKNPQQFAEIAKLAQTKGSKLRFRIYGDGSERKNLKSFVAKHQLHNLEIHPYNADKEAAFYQGASALCVTSNTEALSIVTLKAFACKTPVVAPAKGGPKELIEASGAGILLKQPRPADFLRALENLAQPKRQQLHGARGRQFVLANNTRANFDHNIVNIYQKALKLPTLPGIKED